MAFDRAAARRFIFANGRLLDQHLASVMFDHERPTKVVTALAGYRNEDGGFGHGLEPDKRTPHSQPLDVEIALEYLVSAEAHAPDLVASACEWLASISDPTGAVPVLLPTIEGFPRAEHWASTSYKPDLNPTAAIAAHCLSLGASHPWIERATEYWFSDDSINRHLEALDQAQQEDGGWPLSWTPPSIASGCEWRAIRTLSAARTLVAYSQSK